MKDPPEGFSVNDRGDSVEYTMTQRDEGTVFEQLIFFSMNEIYRGQSFLRPIVKITNRNRELADLLSIDYDNKTMSIIQAKTIAALEICMKQSSERRSSSIEKQAKKALKQLKGAIRQIRAGNQVFDSNHNQIEIPDPAKIIIHAIIIVSEFYPFANWKKIGNDLVSISENDQYMALFHILDLLELQQMVTNSESSNSFHNYLFQRWVMVKKTGTAYVRGRARRPYDNEVDRL